MAFVNEDAVHVQHTTFHTAVFECTPVSYLNGCCLSAALQLGSFLVYCGPHVCSISRLSVSLHAFTAAVMQILTLTHLSPSPTMSPPLPLPPPPPFPTLPVYPFQSYPLPPNPPWPPPFPPGNPWLSTEMFSPCGHFTLLIFDVPPLI